MAKLNKKSGVETTPKQTLKEIFQESLEKIRRIPGKLQSYKFGQIPETTLDSLEELLLL